MPTQTVYRLTSQTGFDNLQVFQEPIPEPGPNEVLIKVRSVGLNYRDIVIATGHYPLPIKPQVVPCSDMAGEVIAVGPWSENSMQGPPLAVGDAVTATPSPAFLYGGSDRRPDLVEFTLAGGKQDGVLREYVVMPAHMPVKLPQCTSSKDFVQWAAVPVTVSTAWNALYGNTTLKPGHTVLIQGT
jgi:NADPH:quinone reductase-like Zn-dependent oxidoreductase